MVEEGKYEVQNWEGRLHYSERGDRKPLLMGEKKYKEEEIRRDGLILSFQSRLMYK